MKIIQVNKQASFDYFFLNTYEAGIVLTGNEIKSIRNSNVNLKGSFCKFFKEELFIFGMNISKYEHSNSFSKYVEDRDRKLLLKRSELNKIKKLISEEGITIIPTKIFLNDHNLCKLEIAIAKGKKNYDKRHILKERDIKRHLKENF